MRFALQLLFRPSGWRQTWLPAIFWVALIFLLSSIPGTKYPDVAVPFADKIVHGLLYLPVGFLFARTSSYTVRAKWGSGSLAVGGGWFYGGFDELYQSIIPFRNCSFADWVVDCVAVLLGAIIWILASGLFHKMRKTA